MKPSKSRGPNRLLVTALLLATALAATFLAEWGLSSFFDPLQSQAIDRLFRFRSGVEKLQPPRDETVLLVAIDDRSLAEFEDFYLGRVQHARLVDALGRAGLAVQFHDMVFAAPLDEKADAELARATQRAGNVYYGMAVGLSGGHAPRPLGAEPVRPAFLDRLRFRPQVVGDASRLPAATRYFVTFEQLSGPARGMGYLDVVPERDGVFRRVHLLARDEDGFLPGLPLLVLADFLGVTDDRIELRPGRSITLRGARRPGAEADEDVVIPIDREGRMVVNFRGPWGSFPTYPYAEIDEAAGDRFAMEDLRDELEGRIAIVAWIATGAGDVGSIPTDPLYPLPGIHANVLNTVLTGSFLHELSLLEMLLWVELPLLALLWLAAIRLRTIPFVAIALIMVAGYHLLVAAGFLYGNVILRLPGPVMAIVGSALVAAAYQFHLESENRAVLRSTFDAFFPPTVVDKVMGHSADLASAAQKKELTILFSDIKSFTTHTSEMEAGHVRKLLNEYFERMIEIVFRHEGTLDKFIGDGLMVFFGDPESQPDHAARCVRAAIEMQHAARELNAEWAARGDMPLEIRVGINTGEVIVGNMGSARRLSYTVLGEPVNLAQRLESNAPVGGVLISERTYELLDGAIPAELQEPIRVKGIDRPLTVYVVPVD